MIFMAAMPYRPTSFNHIVGWYLTFTKDCPGRQYILLNDLDIATTYNRLVLYVANKSQQL